MISWPAVLKNAVTYLYNEVESGLQKAKSIIMSGHSRQAVVSRRRGRRRQGCCDTLEKTHTHNETRLHLTHWKRRGNLNRRKAVQVRGINPDFTENNFGTSRYREGVDDTFHMPNFAVVIARFSLYFKHLWACLRMTEGCKILFE